MKSKRESMRDVLRLHAKTHGMNNSKCKDCGLKLESWEGVNCGGYDLCDSCYDVHTPRVGNAEACVGASDELPEAEFYGEAE